MSGFLPDKQVRNEEADKPWLKSDTDKMLDEFFAGASPSRLAQALKRNPKAIKRRLEQFFYNEQGRAERYQPVRRVSRVGKRWTQNEVLFRKAAAKRNVSAKIVATVLARGEKEVGGLLYGLEKEQEQKGLKSAVKNAFGNHIPITMDLIWAFHYLYHRCGKKIITDQGYDDLVKEEIEYGGGTRIFKLIKEQDDYPGRIRSLANYLLLTSLERQREEDKKL